MNKDELEYINHRLTWKSPEFLNKLFGKKVDMKSAKVKEFLNTIESIPKSPIYTIVAYGSLLNIGDIYRTMPTAHNFRKGSIHGFKRIFNMGRPETGCVLNIEPTEVNTDSVICHFIDISYKDLPSYILREGWYDIIQLSEDEYTDSLYKDNNIVLTVIGDESIIYTSIAIEPQLNYLHLCIDGIKDVAGWKGVQNFINETICYSVEENDYITVKEWLDTVNLTRYFNTKMYNSR